MTSSRSNGSAQIERVPIDSIFPDPANVRKHNTKNLDAIKGSLARFGQQKPLVVDGDGIVRAGNGTLAAAQALKWTHIDILRTALTGSEATAYAISDNRTAELAEWDGDALAQTLRSLADEGFPVADIGYDDKELDKLIGGDDDGADVAGLSRAVPSPCQGVSPTYIMLALPSTTFRL